MGGVGGVWASGVRERGGGGGQAGVGASWRRGPSRRWGEAALFVLPTQPTLGRARRLSYRMRATLAKTQWDGDGAEWGGAGQKCVGKAGGSKDEKKQQGRVEETEKVSGSVLRLTSSVPPRRVYLSWPSSTACRTHAIPQASRSGPFQAASGGPLLRLCNAKDVAGALFRCFPSFSTCQGPPVLTSETEARGVAAEAPEPDRTVDAWHPEEGLD